MLRLAVVLLAGFAVLALAGCGGGGVVRERPDIDPPERAAAAPLVDGAPDGGWVERTGGAAGIPARVLVAYAAAEARAAADDPGCGIGWNLLAGIGRIESIHGVVNGSAIGGDGVARPSVVGIALDGDGVAAIDDSDRGRLDGDAVWDRAVGPMQFIPETWARWGADGDGDGRRNPQDVDDAALAAARYLCDAGGDLTTRNGYIDAVLTYNRSAAYGREVAATATEYARAAGR